MPRRYRFVIDMTVQNDDQTDPEDMQEIIEDVLNCKQDATARWQETHDEIEPESRAKFGVQWTEGL
jgi:hypothetical protein